MTALIPFDGDVDCFFHFGVACIVKLKIFNKNYSNLHQFLSFSFSPTEGNFIAKNYSDVYISLNDLLL